MSAERTRGRAYNPLLKSYPDSVKVNSCSILAELLYVRLIAKADDAGRYWAGPKRLLGKLLTQRWERDEVDEAGIIQALDELETAGLISRYEVGADTYLEIVGVYRAIRNDRPPVIDFPAPPGSEDPEWSAPTGVYVVESGGLYKIGFSSNIPNRISTLRNSGPDRGLRLVSLDTAGTRHTERALHERFAASRRHGEWFDPSPELSGWIAAHPVPDGLDTDCRRNGRAATDQATATATTQPNQATDQATARAGARVAVDNPFGLEVVAAAVAAGAGPPTVQAALAKADRFLGAGKRGKKATAALNNWLFVKADKAEAAIDRLITWARTRDNPQGALLHAITGGYADDHAA